MRALELLAEGAADEAGEDVAGAGLEEARGAGGVHRAERVAPADRLGQRRQQVGADVVEGRGGDRGEGAASAGGELGRARGRRGSRATRGLHQRRVEGAGDRQADRLGAFGAQRLARFADLLGVAGEDDLAGRVVVGERSAELAGDLADDLVGAAERGEHAAGVGPREASSIRRPRTTARRRPALGVERAAGDQRRQLAERVAGVDTPASGSPAAFQWARPAQKSAGWAKWVPSPICSKGSAPSSSRACSSRSGSWAAATAAIVERLAALAGEEKCGVCAGVRHCKEYWSGRRAAVTRGTRRVPPFGGRPRRRAGSGPQTRIFSRCAWRVASARLRTPSLR